MFLIVRVVGALVLSATFQIQLTVSESCPTKCEWTSWNSWNSCSATCAGGHQTRDRSLCCAVDWDVGQCLSKCGRSRSGFYDSSTCNEDCTHGHYSNGRCHCSPGHYGTCCRGTVTCGRPSAPAHGSISGSRYQYGDVIRYSCRADYTLTGGDPARTCSISGYWSGTKPACVFSNTCGSNPCQHGAGCFNGLNRYDCKCSLGWSGTNCEIDILPLQVIQCPSNKTHYISTPTVTLNWTAPTFSDLTVRISSNYRLSGATFPWGEFFIQYVATKPSNGLRTECLFTESIYPRPCKSLVVPDNGAVACNGWNGRFGEVCTVLCQQTRDLPPGEDIKRLYVCGASGQWIPEMDIGSCSEPHIGSGESDEANRHYYSGDCDDEREQIGERYIEILKESDMHDMCTGTRWAASCVPEKAKVACGKNTAPSR